jgi:N-acetylneuraminic acid mutarotase
LSGPIDSVEMFDIETWKWKEMKKLPTPTAIAASIVVHDGILFLGQ